MKSETSLIAAQCRIQQWAADIQSCQARPKEMSVEDWCLQQGITKASYYYRLRRVRQACLNHMERDFVPIPQEVLAPLVSGPDTDSSHELCLSIGDISIHIGADMPLTRLSEILQAVRSC